MTRVLQTPTALQRRRTSKYRSLRSGVYLLVFFFLPKSAFSQVVSQLTEAKIADNKALPWTEFL